MALFFFSFSGAMAIGLIDPGTGRCNARGNGRTIYLGENKKVFKY